MRNRSIAADLLRTVRYEVIPTTSIGDKIVARVWLGYAYDL